MNVSSQITAVIMLIALIHKGPIIAIAPLVILGMDLTAPV